MKSGENKKGYVSRSVFQKMKEEEKRLLNDIYAMVMDPLSTKSILITHKWRDKFEQEKEFNKLLKEACMQYLKDHPEYGAVASGAVWNSVDWYG